MAHASLWALGLMSGTSLDGIDAALIRTDGEAVAEYGPWLTLPYAAELRERIRSVLGGAGPVAEVERELTDAHADAVRTLLKDCPVKPDLIGFHGHTILHQPERRRTWQIGDGARLAQLTGIDVVHDFRSADVTAGGQGAPFAPLYHAALARRLDKPVAVLNVGGVANVTWIGADGGVLAFDTGPGNAPIDDWVRQHTGRPCDEGGKLAAMGRVREAILLAMLENPWFDAKPPKSLDRDDFTCAPARGLSLADGAATLTEFTARAVALAQMHFAAKPVRWLVTGGGRHNPTMLAALRRLLSAPVDPVEAAGWRGDAIEAEAFGFLAVRSRRGLPLSVPGTTGVPAPQPGGRFVAAAG